MAGTMWNPSNHIDRSLVNDRQSRKTNVKDNNLGTVHDDSGHVPRILPVPSESNQRRVQLCNLFKICNGTEHLLVVLNYYLIAQPKLFLLEHKPKVIVKNLHPNISSLHYLPIWSFITEEYGNPIKSTNIRRDLLPMSELSGCRGAALLNIVKRAVCWSNRVGMP
ncbi:hypothetical protein ACJW30_01G233900 [Castanea mollissima]